MLCRLCQREPCTVLLSRPSNPAKGAAMQTTISTITLSVALAACGSSTQIESLEGDPVNIEAGSTSPDSRADAIHEATCEAASDPGADAFEAKTPLDAQRESAVNTDSTVSDSDATLHDAGPPETGTCVHAFQDCTPGDVCCEFGLKCQKCAFGLDAPYYGDGASLPYACC